MTWLRNIWFLGVALAAALIAGPEAFARLAYAAGWSKAAVALSSHPGVEAVGLFGQRRYDEADAAFERIGRGATYNRGMTLATTGNHYLSVAYFDAVLFGDRWDADARHNRELVATLFKPIVGETVGHGRVAAMLEQAGLKVAEHNADNPLAATMISREDYRKPIDARSVTADSEWLDTLDDAPGEYLKKRLEAEYQRRFETGTAAPQEASPW